MNYLSHFFIGQHVSEDPEYALGLILPDLSRGYVKSPGKHKDTLPETYREFVEGCLYHYTCDKLFHASEFFHWGSSIAIQELKDAKFQGEVQRRWFLGHVLFELLLDRILIQHHTGLVERFYDLLGRTSLHRVQAFVLLHEHKEADRFFRNFDHFRRVGYIRNYPDNNLFVYSLNRIAQRAGLPPLSLADQVVMREVVEKLESYWFRNAQEMMFRLKSVFA